jgi:hypothetical protein
MHIIVVQVPSGLQTDDVKLDCTCPYKEEIDPTKTIMKIIIKPAIMNNETNRCIILYLEVKGNKS